MSSNYNDAENYCKDCDRSIYGKMAIEALKGSEQTAETTQIDHTADVSKKVSISCGHENDLISRQALYKYAQNQKDKSVAPNDIMWFPSAQPEIVRCKDCKWYELPSHKITENCVRWMKRNSILLPIKPDDYCSYAERRTDDKTNKGSSC